jgi:hypothetical protein
MERPIMGANSEKLHLLAFFTVSVTHIILYYFSNFFVSRHPKALARRAIFASNIAKKRYCDIAIKQFFSPCELKISTHGYLS